MAKHNPSKDKFHPARQDSRTLFCLRFSSKFGDLGILPHISNVQKSVSKVRDGEALGHLHSHHPTKGDRKCSSSQSSSVKVSPPRSRPPSLGWGIMSRMAWTSTTRKRRTRTMSRRATLRAAALCRQCSRQLPLQPPGCATLRASVRFACPEARRPTLGRTDLFRQPRAPGRPRRVSVTWRRRCSPRGATFGHKAAKSVCSFCVLQLHSQPGAEDRRQCDPDVDGSSCNLICFHDGLAANQDAPLTCRRARIVVFSSPTPS